MFRTVGIGCIALACLVGPAPAQEAQEGLRTQFRELFTFGDCGDLLCLPGISFQTGHGNHFIPSAGGANQSLIQFIAGAIGQSVSNIPVPSTSGGPTFVFVGGLPVQTSESPGPIFGERAQTIGRGRFIIGLNATGVDFNSLRGVPLDDLTFNFTHQDVDPAGLGTPTFENDVIEVKTSLNVNLFVAQAFFTYGLTDFIDLGVSVPLVRTSISGESVARVVPSSVGSPVHTFGGTAVDPVLLATATTDGSASGIGDIAGRLKIAFTQNTTVGFGILGDVRFPTGDDENLLGAGEASGRALGILSARLGTFSPHANFGYLFRKSTIQSDAFLATVGFDNMLSSWAAVAVDFISEIAVGENDLELPEPVVYSDPFPHVINPTSIPDRRDDIISASVGFKFVTRGGVTLVTNALVPIGDGGLRSDFVWTAGLEYGF